MQARDWSVRSCGKSGILADRGIDLPIFSLKFLPAVVHPLGIDSGLSSIIGEW